MYNSVRYDSVQDFNGLTMESDNNVCGLNNYVLAQVDQFSNVFRDDI